VQLSKTSNGDAMKIKIPRVFFALSLLFSSSVMAADAYPSRPISLVVPLAAGSTADILARVYQQKMTEKLGQTIVVENKPGGSGLIGMNHVARSTPDGYTLVLASNGTWAINVGLFQDLSYDPVKDFVPVAYLAGVSNVLVVAGDS